MSTTFMWNRAAYTGAFLALVAIVLSCSSTVTGESTLAVSSITPPAGANDVSIESTIRIQFSAPLNASTVDATTVVVRGAGGAAVPGTFAVSGNTVTFTPTGLLAEFAAGYTVTVTAAVRGAAGEHLPAQFASSFTTAFWDPSYYYRITNESQAGKSLDTFAGTFGCFMGNNGTFTGQAWYFVPIASQAGYYLMRNQFQGDTKALDGSDSPNRCFLANLAPSGQPSTGQSWRIVPYGAPYANGYRLQSQNLGAAKSLGLTIVNSEPYPTMMATADMTVQVWYFTRLARR
jgi:hypothetical protein